MNYKLEKFWNDVDFAQVAYNVAWTINLKSFEIMFVSQNYTNQWQMNYKLEKFWNLYLFPKEILEDFYEL